ncbi:MAG TPA: PDZ domain-containing protein [Acidimicrobiia bacterium]|nr:PDZ domain-containing protein [Acidimicrobiia bacterium]
MSEEETSNEPAPDAGNEEPTVAEPATADTSAGDATDEQPALVGAATPPPVAAGGPAPAELGWGAPPPGALPPGAVPPPEPPAAPPTEPVGPVPAGATPGRRWTPGQGLLAALLVLLIGLGGGFAIGRATADSGPSSLADAVHKAANGDLPLGNTNGSLRELFQELGRNGNLQQILRDLLGELGRNGNGRNLFPPNPRTNPVNPNVPDNGGNQTPATSSAFLGVQVSASSNGQGVAVDAVQSGSPAADAGLKAGDVITAVDGTTVNSPAALSNAIRSHQPGDSVKITYTRGGTSTDVQVRLGNRSSTTTTTAPPA